MRVRSSCQSRSSCIMRSSSAYWMGEFWALKLCIHTSTSALPSASISAWLCSSWVRKSLLPLALLAWLCTSSASCATSLSSAMACRNCLLSRKGVLGSPEPARRSMPVAYSSACVRQASMRFCSVSAHWFTAAWRRASSSSRACSVRCSCDSSSICLLTVFQAAAICCMRPLSPSWLSRHSRSQSVMVMSLSVCSYIRL